MIAAALALAAELMLAPAGVPMVGAAYYWATESTATVTVVVSGMVAGLPVSVAVTGRPIGATTSTVGCVQVEANVLGLSGRGPWPLVVQVGELRLEQRITARPSWCSPGHPSRRCALGRGRAWSCPRELPIFADGFESGTTGAWSARR